MADERILTEEEMNARLIENLKSLTTEELIDFRESITERGTFHWMRSEANDLALITAEILSRVTQPVHKALPTAPHTDLQILLGAVAIVLTVILGVIPGMWWLHAILATAICSWLAWHWQYLFPGKVSA